MKQAGVVDARGAGVVLLLDALLQVAAGRALPAPPLTPPAAAPTLRPGVSQPPQGPRYEVSLLLETPEECIGDV